jgi:tetratricopeptide (TPR) repeat protein
MSASIKNNDTIDESATTLCNPEILPQPHYGSRPMSAPRKNTRPGKLQVMISSTSLDLPAHRKAAEDAALRAGMFPLAMEHGSATSNSDAIRYSLDLVDQADIYVGLFAHRYGFIPDNKADNPQRWSVTEHEYRRAVERGIPRLIFLAHDEHPFLPKDFDFEPEKRDKLTALKNELEIMKVCGMFKSPDHLNTLVSQSLFEEKGRLAPGRVEVAPSCSLPPPPEFYTVPAYTLTSRFIGRRSELSLLDEWATSTNPILVVDAIGGMGKSALTWEWARQHAIGKIPDLAGRIWWSFYERGTSMKSFLRHALAYVTSTDPETLRGLPTPELGRRLLLELRSRPFLLVLDGFERVLSAYHRSDKAQMRDDKVPMDKRECTNPRDGDVLCQFLDCSPSKVLVSTRLMPKVLEDRHTHQAIPGVQHLLLEGLAPPDALSLVRHAGVRGDEVAILRFADQFGRHALVLRIVCGMVSDYRPRPGDFDAWRADPREGGGLKMADLELKQRYTHILDHAFRGLGEKSRQLLSRIAALSDAASYDAIAVLNPFVPAPPPVVPVPRSWESKEPHARYQQALKAYKASAEYHQGCADFHAALRDLEERGLIQWDRDENTYDMHPVVRAFAFEQLEHHDRRHTYNVLRDHFASLPPENVRDATELVHVKNTIEIVRALIGAGRTTEAITFYKGGFSNALLFSIGGYHTVVELMSSLLAAEQAAPGPHSSSTRSDALNELAVATRHLGNPEAALGHYAELIKLDLDDNRTPGVSTSIRSYARCLRELNRLAEAEQADQLAWDLASRAGNESGLTTSMYLRMIGATIGGRFEEAEAHDQAFQKRSQPPRHMYRVGQVEYWRAVRHFQQGRLTEEELVEAQKKASAANSVIEQHQLFALRCEWELSRNDPTKALDAIEQAISVVRRTGEPTADYLALRALALARLGESAEASELLIDTVHDWDERLPMFAIHAAEAWLVLGEVEQARTLLRKAYPLAWADGPAHVRWYDLKRCRELMAQIGEREPKLPAFQASKMQRVPYELAIRAVIDKLKVERDKEQADR